MRSQADIMHFMSSLRLILLFLKLLSYSLCAFKLCPCSMSGPGTGLRL
jgi:hypothetical protein